MLAYGYWLFYLAAGMLFAARLFPQASFSLWMPLGCGFGVSLLAALPALWAVVLGFTAAAAYTAGATVFLGLAVLLFAFRAPAKGHNAEKDRLSRKDTLLFLLCVVPLFLFTCVLLNTHVLRLVDGAYHTGQSCYGDMPMHLGFIKNIAVTGSFPPSYPLLGGEHRFGYPFLCETVSSVFLILGADLRTAYLLPVFPALLSVYGMVWHTARRVLGSAGKASLAYGLFFLGSGFGFVYFIGSPETFKGIFTGFYTTPTNFAEKNILWVNPIADLLIPQRATLFGWTVLFPALYLLWRFCFEEERRLWLPMALLVLPLPLMHTHSALALVLICLVCGVYSLVEKGAAAKVILPWFGFAVLCGVCWLAEMWGTVLAQSMDGQHMLRFWFNWVNNAGSGKFGQLKENYFLFYIKNIGLVYLLLIPAFLHAGKKLRWLYGGGLLILLLSEFVLFQPNPYDNNKLLFLWHFLGCLLVANFLVDTAKALPAAAGGVLLALCCFLGTFGSVLTLGREYVSDYRQWSADDIALAEYVDANAEADCLFLTSDSHLTPVFALAGRQILCGSGSYVYYHGMDYAKEANAMKQLYENPDEQTLQDWKIQYVLFDSFVYGRFHADEGWYAERYPLWYQNAGCRVYKITE